MLGELAGRIKERIRNIPGLVDITDNFDRGLPEIAALPDQHGHITLALTLLRCVGWLSRDDLALVLFEQALLSEGAVLADPADFVRRVNQLLVG